MDVGLTAGADDAPSRSASAVRLNLTVFWTVQASALLAFLVPFSWSLVGLAALSHGIRMLGITVGFHRHLAHRAYRTSRPVRFFWALLGTTAMQKGPIWWAGSHVYHHRFADRAGDPHSPLLGGFYHAHMGWFLDDVRWDRLDPANAVARDFSPFPEMRFLDRFYGVPPILLALALYWAGGLPWLAWGFCVPTVTLAHATFAINSVNHLWGTRRFATPDGSRNNALTAFFTLGEGWHNNHHRYQRAARNGFRWWEWDPSYWMIRAMGVLGLAWDIEPLPEHVRRELAGEARAVREALPRPVWGEAEERP
jgi:stearoyl-CoA desaturase (Delta-9 desaturase)